VWFLTSHFSTFQKKKQPKKLLADVTKIKAPKPSVEVNFQRASFDALHLPCWPRFLKHLFGLRDSEYADFHHHYPEKSSDESLISRQM